MDDVGMSDSVLMKRAGMRTALLGFVGESWTGTVKILGWIRSRNLLMMKKGFSVSLSEFRRERKRQLRSN